jgi:hypothetical protein
MAQKDKNQGETKDRERRRPYHPPRMFIYGAVKDLTAGGSGHAQELSSGQLMRP